MTFLIKNNFMQTTKDRVSHYCEKNNYEMPYGQHLNYIGSGVVEALKAQGKYEGIEKLTVVEEMEVNNYPEDLFPLIDEAIESFFKDRNSFIRKLKGQTGSKLKKFMYVVEDHKTSAFEKALAKCEITFEINHGFSQEGKLQYIIPIPGFAKLITLGKIFQKERDAEKRQQRKPVQK